MKSKNPVMLQVWLSLIGGFGVMVYTMMSYGHSNFMNIREKQELVSRLDRIELKLDEVKDMLRER